MRVVGRSERQLSTAAGAFQRSIGISGDVTGATQLWSAEVELVEVPAPDGWTPETG